MSGLALVHAERCNVQLPVSQWYCVQPGCARLRLVVQRRLSRCSKQIRHQRRPIQRRSRKSHRITPSLSQFIEVTTRDVHRTSPRPSITTHHITMFTISTNRCCSVQHSLLIGERCGDQRIPVRKHKPLFISSLFCFLDFFSSIFTSMFKMMATDN